MATGFSDSSVILDCKVRLPLLETCCLNSTVSDCKVDVGLGTSWSLTGKVSLSQLIVLVDGQDITAVWHPCTD